MTLSLDGFNDTKFPGQNNIRNKSLMRYNDTTGSFDLVYIDPILGIITDSPQAFNEKVAGDLRINNITRNTIDGGSF